MTEENHSEDNHYDNASKAILELKNFVSFTWGGVHFAKTATTIAKAGRKLSLGPFAEMDEELFGKRLQKYETLAEFAGEQVKSGFPTLYNIACTHLWCILESHVFDLVVETLSKVPSDKLPEIMDDIKIPFRRFVELIKNPEDERHILLAEELKRNVSSNSQPGIGSLESLLNPVGLGGGVPTVINRVLLELSQIRNLVMHRNGVADRVFIGKCPWFELSVGDKLHLDENMFASYIAVVKYYMVELAIRSTPEYQDDTYEGDEAFASTKSVKELRDSICKSVARLRPEHDKSPEDTI